MEWDWYSATVPAGPDEVLAVLEGHCGLWSVRPCRGLYSYAQGAEVGRDSEIVARAFWGGVNGDDVHVQASGHSTPGIVSLVRSQWPQHRVSRADSRIDWSHPKAWRWVTKIALEVADWLDVRTSTVGDWIRAKEGRTLYLGSKSSRVQMRIYEKGKQLGVDPNWVRMEVQIRPSGEGKSQLAAATPAQLMQSSIWTAAIAEQVGVPKLEAVRVRDPWTQSDDDRALSYCLRQYGAVLTRKAQQAGGWPQLGEQLGELLSAPDPGVRH